MSDKFSHIIVLLLFVCIAIQYGNYLTTKKQFDEKIEDREVEINRLNDVISDWENLIAVQSEENASLKTEIETLKTQPIRYIGTFKVTYYCSCEQCCGKTDGITASGAKVAEGVTVAADISMLPFGTKIYIEGIGERIVQDTGGKIKGNKLDVYVASHEQVPSVGVHNASVWVVTE